MTKEQIEKEIAEMNEWIPVSKIEENLGMPPTTLQKVLKGKRELPKKWVKKLEAYFVVNSVPVTEKKEFKYPLEEMMESIGNSPAAQIEKEVNNLLQKESMAEKLARLKREAAEKNKK